LPEEDSIMIPKPTLRELDCENNGGAAIDPEQSSRTGYLLIIKFWEPKKPFEAVSGLQAFQPKRVFLRVKRK
jgi:hypothetical protein